MGLIGQVQTRVAIGGTEVGRSGTAVTGVVSEGRSGWG